MVPDHYKSKAKQIRDAGVACECDLDNWQPEKSTGHTWVCPIHIKTIIALTAEGKR